MQIDLINIDEFIKVNRLPEITNPIIFEKGYIPTSDGLLSTDIFGVSTKDRKDTYAYISLNGHFLHPFIYTMLKRMNRNFESIIYGTKKFIVDAEGRLKEDVDGDSGLEYLYKIWDKIKFEKNLSRMRNERIDLLEITDKDELFTKYWIVCPAFYRDKNIQAGSKVGGYEEVTEIYSKLIRMAMMLKNTNNFDFVLETTRGQIQQLLVDIFNKFKGKIEKKQGIIKKSLLSKNIDYGARLVISAPRFTTNRPEDMDIDFYHTGVPLANCCSLFTPFFTSWIKNFFIREFEKIGSKVQVQRPDGEVRFIQLKDPALYFNEDYIKKQIDKFVFSYADRFEKIYMPVDEADTQDGKGPELIAVGKYYKKGVPETESPIFNKRLTWCDLLYMAAVDITSDKYIYITRYPLLDYFGTFVSKPTVLSTHNTIAVYIGDRLYKNYPDIDLTMDKNSISTAFIDTLVMSNLYLAGLGGD